MWRIWHTALTTCLFSYFLVLSSITTVKLMRWVYCMTDTIKFHTATNTTIIIFPSFLASPNLQHLWKKWNLNGENCLARNNPPLRHFALQASDWLVCTSSINYVVVFLLFPGPLIFSVDEDSRQHPNLSGRHYSRSVLYPPWEHQYSLLWDR